MNNAIKKLNIWEAPTGRLPFMRLDLNENASIISDSILLKLRNFGAETIYMYPEYDVLNSQLAKYNGVRKSQILAFNGSDQAIDSIMRALFNVGDTLLIPSPVFSVFYHFARVNQLKVMPLYYKKGYQGVSIQWSFPIKEAIDVLRSAKPKGLILVNPNNPIGVGMPQEYLAELVKMCKRRNIYLVIDEAYYEFYGSSAKSFLKSYPKLVIIRTLSKYFGLAGLRIGYIISDEVLIKQVKKVRTPWSVSNFSVYAALVLLRNKKYVSDKNKDLHKYKNDLLEFFHKNSTKSYMTETNFLVVEVDNSKQLLRSMKRNGILLNDLSDYPYSRKMLKNCIRITIPAGDDLLYFKHKFSKAVRTTKCSMAIH